MSSTQFCVASLRRGREEVEESTRSARRFTHDDIIYFAPRRPEPNGIHPAVCLCEVVTLCYIAGRNLPRSIDTSVHGAGKLSRPQSFALWKVLLSVERSTGPFCEKGSTARGGKEERAAGRYYVLSPSSPLGCLDKYTGVHYWGWRSVSKRLKVRIYIPHRAIYDALERFTRQFFSLRNLAGACARYIFTIFVAHSEEASRGRKK